MIYEPRGHRLLPRRLFLWRLFNHGVIAFGVIAGSLLVGMSGYVYFERMAWLDAFLNAAMLLGGMGPVDQLKTDGGKLFAGLYALYAGLVVLAVAGLLLAPFAHRLLHRFHWDSDAD